VLKIKEAIIAWALTLIVVTGFARRSNFGWAEELFIDVLLVLALPLAWGLNSLTFWHPRESIYKYSQALAFPLSIVLGVSLTFVITNMLGADIKAVETLLLFVVLSIFFEYYIENQIHAYQTDVDCSPIQACIGQTATFVLWGSVGFLLVILAYGRLRFFGAIDGNETIDAVALFIINDLHVWFLEDA